VLEAWHQQTAHDGVPREVLLIVGPEGGISPREVTRLCGAGAVTALLGHHVLRSSTAGPAATVLASDILRRW
jgi:16S rRNA (uracil1498-N3)-methyltransferase